jgi:hypothetical protein
MNEAKTSPGAVSRVGTVAAGDLPTRLFKWALVLLVLLAWGSNRYGDVTLTWHKWNGYAILVLLVFRCGDWSVRRRRALPPGCRRPAGRGAMDWTFCAGTGAPISRTIRSAR